MRSARGVLLVPHSHRALGVSVGACGFYRSPSPAHLRKRVHPLVSFAPLQSAAVSCPPNASRRRAPSLGSAFPLRDISLRRPLRNRGSTPEPPCRPWRFSRLRRFSPPLALWVYFTPQPRPGFPFRVFSSHTAVLSSSLRSCPRVG